MLARPDSTAIVVPAPDRLVAVQSSGQVSWARRFPADDSIVASPRVALDSTVYVLTRKHLHAIGPTGASLFRLALPFEQRTLRRPEQMRLEALPDSNALLSDGEREVVKIDARGTVKWRFGLPGRDTITSAPRAAPDGTIYLRSRAWLYGLSGAGKQLWRLPLQQLATAQD